MQNHWKTLQLRVPAILGWNHRKWKRKKTLLKQRPPKLKRNGIRAMRIHVFVFPLLLAFMRFHFYFTWFNCDARGDSAQCHSPLFLCTIFTNCKEALDNNNKVHNNATLFHSAVCDWMPFFWVTHWICHNHFDPVPSFIGLPFEFS